MFTADVHKLITNGLIAEDFFETTDESYGIDHEGPLGQLENNTSIVEFFIEQLNSINVLSKSDIMGVDIYLSVLHNYCSSMTVLYNRSN